MSATDPQTNPPTYAPGETIKEQILVSLSELAIESRAFYGRSHESLLDFLTFKLEEKLGRALNQFQPFCYGVVGVQDDADIIFELEGEEE